VDYCLGLLFKGPEEMGFFEDSLILLTADHGEFLRGSTARTAEYPRGLHPGCEHRAVDALA